MKTKDNHFDPKNLEARLRKLAKEKGMGIEANNDFIVISPKPKETEQQMKARYIDGLSYSTKKPENLFDNYVLNLHYLTADIIMNDDSTNPELSTLNDVLTVVSGIIAEGKMNHLDEVLRANFKDHYEEE